MEAVRDSVRGRSLPKHEARKIVEHSRERSRGPLHPSPISST